MTAVRFHSLVIIWPDWMRTARPYRDCGRLGLVPPQPMLRKVRFEIRPWGQDREPARELLPYVDNVSLVALVSGFEHAAGHDMPGTYAGIVLDHFDGGDLTAYLTGRSDLAYRSQDGMIALLGCDCGEVGCWPLEAKVITTGFSVTWRGFSQPYRPRRDYGDFGPFVFRRNQYERAVREAAAARLPSSPNRRQGSGSTASEPAPRSPRVTW
ncbi:hypothetical protein [Salinispora arenicola]|uniref:hypothetical protein n=2 Tax=Salinispora arenicola TaxID=168697 RepID=UPI0003643288|nr:hypothetical protein [Salinispora arenicola]